MLFSGLDKKTYTYEFYNKKVKVRSHMRNTFESDKFKIHGFM